MSDLIFQPPRGLTWSVNFSPLFNTLVQEADNGREVRTPLQEWPRWEITFTINYLHDDPNNEAWIQNSGNTELDELMGFFLARKGSFDDFLVNVSSFTRADKDSVVTGVPIGLGDGVTTQFQLVKPRGTYYLEPIQSPQGQVASILVSGVAKVQNVDYTIADGLVTFLAAPVLNAPIVASFIALYRVRFNTQEAGAKRSGSSVDPQFENFMFQLHRCRQISLVTVLL